MRTDSVSAAASARSAVLENGRTSTTRAKRNPAVVQSTRKRGLLWACQATTASAASTENVARRRASVVTIVCGGAGITSADMFFLSLDPTLAPRSLNFADSGNPQESCSEYALGGSGARL